MVATYPIKKRCHCDERGETCKHSWDTYAEETNTRSPDESHSGLEFEAEKRVVEEKMQRLENKRELNETQHWKHKNKPKF